MRRVGLTLALAIALVAIAPQAAYAEPVASKCGTRWQLDGSEGLNWCSYVGYNDTTGSIQGGFSYSDYQTGNVYGLLAVNVILWRQTEDGTISVKDACDSCPLFRFVFNDADRVTTGWSGFNCGRTYWAESDFQVQWEPDGAITGTLERNSPAISLC